VRAGISQPPGSPGSCYRSAQGTSITPTLTHEITQIQSYLRLRFDHSRNLPTAPRKQPPQSRCRARPSRSPITHHALLQPLQRTYPHRCTTQPRASARRPLMRRSCCSSGLQLAAAGRRRTAGRALTDPARARHRSLSIVEPQIPPNACVPRRRACAAPSFAQPSCHQPTCITPARSAA